MERKPCSAASWINLLIVKKAPLMGACPAESAIQQYLRHHKLDWLIIPREDEFLGEAVPSYNERLAWATGFTGSAGIAVISPTTAHLFVDGRYTLQANQETTGIIIHRMSELWEWASLTFNPKDVIGLNLKFHTQGFLQKLQTIPCTIRHLDPHPVDMLWADRPSVNLSLVRPHPLPYSGETTPSKLERILSTLAPEAEALYVQDPHDVAWALNIRGQDLPYTPIALARALIWKNGDVQLFLNHADVSAEVRQYLGNNVNISPMHAIDEALLKPQRLQMDPNVSAYDRQRLGDKAIIQASPIVLMKAIKNAVEIEGMRQAHRWDAEAVCKFRNWLRSETPMHLDEIKSAQTLEDFRQQCPAYTGPSFPTISEFGPNGAVVHYHATPKTNRTFEANGLYLVDSGGQYLEGTTDITRTFAIGNPTAEYRHAYTLVLKGHLRLANAVFPKGTTGHQLDALARFDLWQAGLNYDHGTGHGVGSYLSVHEGPHSISPRANGVALQPGMVVSNEPGYYKAGEFGIRIENMMVVQESAHDGFLRFETLTKVPYEAELIDESLLSAAEIDWIARET